MSSSGAECQANNNDELDYVVIDDHTEARATDELVSSIPWQQMVENHFDARAEQAETDVKDVKSLGSSPPTITEALQAHLNAESSVEGVEFQHHSTDSETNAGSTGPDCSSGQEQEPKREPTASSQSALGEKHECAEKVFVVDKESSIPLSLDSSSILAHSTTPTSTAQDVDTECTESSHPSTNTQEEAAMKEEIRDLGNSTEQASFDDDQEIAVKVNKRSPALIHRKPLKQSPVVSPPKLSSAQVSLNRTGPRKAIIAFAGVILGLWIIKRLISNDA